MAVGDGGFKQVPFGFDKNEVNTYISDLRKKMKSMEEDMKANDKKTAEAEKLAEEADERIQAAVKEGEDKCAELENRLSAADSRAEKLEAEVSRLKNELQDERKKMSDMLLSGKGVNAEANKAYTEIIDRAKADADDIISGANAKAADIVAAANANCEGINNRTAEFLEAVKAQIETLTSGYNSINASAAQLLGAEIPEIQPIKLEAAPAAAQPAPAPVIAEEAVIEEVSAPATQPEPEEEVVSEITASEEVMEIKSSSDDMPEITEADKEVGDELASFDDVWGGNELAQTIYNNEKKDAVPLVNPDAKDLFGNDMFSADSEAESDLSADFTPPQEDDMVDEVKPLDVSDVSDAKFDNGFDNDLLAQTMPSNALEGMDDALLEAVKAAEAAFAVQPTNSELSDFDMDEHEEEPAANTEDELMKALREAEQALNSLAPADAAEDNASAADSADDSSFDSSNPWADLQKQLEDMEQSGSFAAEADIPADNEPSAAAADPAAPSADDSSIWDFGSGANSSSDDDDMSGDMFGGFGGF